MSTETGTYLVVQGGLTNNFYYNPDKLRRVDPETVTVTTEGDSATIEHPVSERLEIPAGKTVTIRGKNVDISSFPNKSVGRITSDQGLLDIGRRGASSPVQIRGGMQANTIGSFLNNVIEGRIIGSSGEMIDENGTVHLSPNMSNSQSIPAVSQTLTAADNAPGSREAQGAQGARGARGGPGGMPMGPVSGRSMIQRATQTPGIIVNPQRRQATQKGRAVQSQLIRAIIESTNVRKNPEPIPVLPRAIQLCVANTCHEETFVRFEHIRVRALANEADLYSMSEPSEETWNYITEVIEKNSDDRVTSADLRQLRMAGGAFDPAESELLTTAALRDEQAIVQEVISQIRKPSQERSFRPLMIYAQECLCESLDKEYAYKSNDMPELSCDVAAVSLPYSDDQCSTGRAALLLACLSFRDRTLFHASIDLTRDVPLKSMPGDPLPFLRHTHGIGMVALSDACHDRIQKMERALDTQYKKLVTSDGMRCASVSPWTALALARACASATIEIRLACMRSKNCRADAVDDNDMDEVDNPVYDTVHHSKTLGAIDERFGTIMMDTYELLKNDSYSTHSLMSIAAGIMRIISVTESHFIELPPTTTQELRIALHVQGSLKLAVEEEGESSFIGSMALHDAKRRWTHVRPEGEEWPGFCISNMPVVDITVVGSDTARARNRVETTGQAALAAVQAATTRLAPGRRTQDTKAMLRALDSAVASHMASVLSMTAALARTSMADRQYVARLNSGRQRQADINAGVITTDMGYDMMFGALGDGGDDTDREPLVPLGQMMSSFSTRPRSLIDDPAYV